MSLYGKKVKLMALFGLDAHVDSGQQFEYADSEKQEDFAAGRLRSDILQMMLRMPKRRVDRYALLRDLDEGLAASILNLYAEEASQGIRGSAHGEQIRVACKGNENIANDGNRLLRRLGLTNNAKNFMRNIAKFGDMFYRLYLKGDKGVEHAVIMDRPEDISCVTDKFRRVTGYKQQNEVYVHPEDTVDADKTVSDPWDYIHFVNDTLLEILPYGASYLHDSYRSLRQIIMSEDSILLYRLLKHPDRFLHTIDTGTADVIDQNRIVNQWVNNLKRRQHHNPSARLFEYRNNPMTPTEDIYFGKSTGSETSIQQLQGSNNAMDIHDLEYWINKFFSEVRVPKAFMGFEGDINKAGTLTSQSIRFARAVASLQQVFKRGIRHLLQIHFRVMDDDDDKTHDWQVEGCDFELEMAYTSGLAELDWLSLLVQRSEYADKLMPYLASPYVNKYELLKYIFSSIIGLSDKEVDLILRKTPQLEATEAMIARLPHLQNLRKLHGKGNMRSEKDIAVELTNGVPLDKVMKEIAWYLDAAIDLNNQANTPLTPFDVGDQGLPSKKLVIAKG